MVGKKIKRATAVTISGTNRARLISAMLTVRPRNRPPLTRASAAAVAIRVAPVAASSGIVSELQAAWPKRAASGRVKTSPYQRKENPPHSVIEVDPLKL